MSIDEVISELSKAPESAKVYFGFGMCIPTTVDSWRGIYAEPALGWTTSDQKPAPTASELISELRASIDGKVFHGWKGGDFTYYGHMPLHINNSGDYTNTEITSIRSEGWAVFIHTQRNDE